MKHLLLKRGLLYFISLCYSILAFSHGEEIKISLGQKGPVCISEEQKAMLSLQLIKPTIKPITNYLLLNGEIRLLPNMQADVGVRISGNVVNLNANLGDTVRIGQKLAVVQSRLIGDPPPTVAVSSPIEGVIDARNVSLGQAVEPNTVLFHISNRKTMLVIAKVYEEDLEKVKVGQEADIHVLSYPNRIFRGKVTLIEPNLDPLTRTVNVQITLRNDSNLLKPGMFVEAKCILSLDNKALIVPNEALIDIAGSRFVFIKDKDCYKQQKVTLGVKNNKDSQVISGLNQEDEVVTQGNRELYTLWLSGGQTSSGSKD